MRDGLISGAFKKTTSNRRNDFRPVYYHRLRDFLSESAKLSHTSDVPGVRGRTLSGKETKYRTSLKTRLLAHLFVA